VRATALDLLQTSATRKIARRMAGLLRDPDPLVRAAAIPLQRAARLEVRARLMSESLRDERRSVRIAAARAILDIIAAHASPTLVRLAHRAVGEYQASLAAKADFPETQIAIAGTALVMRNYRAAEQAFAQAVRMDPQRAEAWRMIARLRAAQNDFDGARNALLDGLTANTNSPILTKMLRDLRRSDSPR
jgi:tetratricopeptide (TPR) repeat protein